jgi:deferrochelatase/peroxidase EfeB
MTKHPFDDVQRIVLRGTAREATAPKSTAWDECRHLVLSFPKGSYPLSFLKQLMKAHLWPTPAKEAECAVQLSLGFSRRGLERVHVPKPLLALFALKSPAFMAGAAVRATSQLGATGSDAPASWDKAFGFMTLDAVLSVHAAKQNGTAATVAAIKIAATNHGVLSNELKICSSLPQPKGVKLQATECPSISDSTPQWTHFGYRDGLSQIGIEGWSKKDKLDRCKPMSVFPAGEFLLGHPQSASESLPNQPRRPGANPWLAGPGQKVWPKEIRAFFANGSFGVLHQMEQHVTEFETFIREKALVLKISTEELKGKLCGRYPNGLPLVSTAGANPGEDFDYKGDPDGIACPFGSHIRRMNPRSESLAQFASDPVRKADQNSLLAHSGRSRPLLRRGMSYGIHWDGEQKDGEARGLMGHFFCASIEDQFEHLIGQWADRVPLGSADTGGARDPLIGAHECNDGPFIINRQDPLTALRLYGLKPFTRTRGTAYLFYPSLQTLEGIASSSLWGALKEDDE